MTLQPIDPDNLTFKHAFESDTELQKYRQLALTFFALSLYLRIENIHEFAAQATTEGGDDKKVDLCYIDEEDGRAVIVQSFFSPRWDRLAAPANKASDLTIAMGWLLSGNESQIPQRLKPKALELRKAITLGDINRIELLIIHNCPESRNVADELKLAADTTRDIVRSIIGDRISDFAISSKEIGLNTIEDLYKSSDSEILVDDWLEIPSQSYIEESGDEWKAIVTSIPGEWVRQLHLSHGDRLFSANFRDYMGSINRKGNINLEIRQTAASEPMNFWVYNNGITAITHELRIEQNRIMMHGISIINGAQTTGSLGESADADVQRLKVLFRIVESRPQDLIQKIIRYNNTQNEIKPADRRSNDAVQNRLRSEFAQHGISYVHRRSALRTPRNAITASAIAPAICAFHGDPQIAYRNARDIFSNDTIYLDVFRNNISSEHVFLIATLSNAVDAIKHELTILKSSSITTKIQDQEYEILKYSPSKHFILFVVGQLAEEIMSRRVSDLFEWKCKPDSISPTARPITQAWVDTLDVILPQIAMVIERQQASVYDIQRSTSMSNHIARELKALLTSLEPLLGSRFALIRSKSTV